MQSASEFVVRIEPQCFHLHVPGRYVLVPPPPPNTPLKPSVSSWGHAYPFLWGCAKGVSKGISDLLREIRVVHPVGLCQIADYLYVLQDLALGAMVHDRAEDLKLIKKRSELKATVPLSTRSAYLLYHCLRQHTCLSS